MSSRRPRYAGMVVLRSLGMKNNTMQLSVPAYLAEHLREGMYFKPELTDDGILFRFVTQQDATSNGRVPEWTQQVIGDTDEVPA